MWFIEVFDDRIGKMIELLYLCNGSSTSRYPEMEKTLCTHGSVNQNMIIMMIILNYINEDLCDC